MGRHTSHARRGRPRLTALFQAHFLPAWPTLWRVVLALGLAAQGLAASASAPVARAAPVAAPAQAAATPAPGRTWRSFYYAADGQLAAVRQQTGAGANTLHYVHGDHLGSVQAATCGNAGGCGQTAVGGVVARQGYQPFGAPRAGAAALPTTRTFTGQIAEAGTGLMYYRARYYAPGLGRFVSPDTLIPDEGRPQTLNRYAYVYNNPVRYTDPSGHCPFCLPLVALAVYMAVSLPGDSGPYPVDAASAAAGDLALRTAVDPYDWVRTGVDCLSGSCSWLEVAAAAAPLASGGLGKLDDLADGLKPAGQAPRLMPLGFKSMDEFHRFGQTLRGGLGEAGFEDVVPIFQGSSVTGFKFTTGAPFDEGRVSDFDIALAGPSLLARAKELGIALRSGGARTEPLKLEHLEALGLLDLREQLSRWAGREVNFMIFGTVEDALNRGPSIVVP